MNERKTENIVRKRLEKLGYYKKGITVEQQQSDNPRIKKLLKNASKRGGGTGYPEFIIHSDKYSDLLIVTECKANHTKHESRDRNRYSEYAVDGALLYASYLSKEFDIIAIGVSGQTQKELRITHYLYLKGTSKPEQFLGNEFLTFENYYDKYKHDPRKFSQDYQSLLNYSQDLNETLHAKKIKEAHRGLLISGILIALRNKAFISGYLGHHTAQQLAESIVATIVNELKTERLPAERIEKLEQAYSFIKTNTTLSTDKEFLEALIAEIDNRLNSFIKTYKYYDTISQFYIKFLRYANNDKGLGIVLTPTHITELYAKIANTNKNSIILDNCCGTGSFLISALRIMVKDAKENERKIREINKNQIIGIEYQDDIYALSISNMIINGDGKSNVLLGDCFNYIKEVKNKYKPTIGLLNPPYKTKDSDIEELEFILNNLEMLQSNSLCVAIIPISCLLAQKGKMLELKRRLIENHTLEAVMSMPNELFTDQDVGVITCTVVITAHIPHPKNKKTWFGYWKNDGFIKTKPKGRIDGGNWKDIERKWLEAFFNRKVIKGQSLMKKVEAEDEWCPEAYMETDYSDLSSQDFENEVRKYIVFKVLNED